MAFIVGEGSRPGVEQHESRRDARRAAPWARSVAVTMPRGPSDARSVSRAPRRCATRRCRPCAKAPGRRQAAPRGRNPSGSPRASTIRHTPCESCAGPTRVNAQRRLAEHPGPRRRLPRRSRRARSGLDHRVQRLSVEGASMILPRLFPRILRGRHRWGCARDPRQCYPPARGGVEPLRAAPAVLSTTRGQRVGARDRVARRASDAVRRGARRDRRPVGRVVRRARGRAARCPRGTRRAAARDSPRAPGRP